MRRPWRFWSRLRSGGRCYGRSRSLPPLHPGRIIPILLPTNDRPEEFRREPAIAVRIVDREILIEGARPLPAVAVGLVYDVALVDTAEEPVPVAVVGGGGR